MTLESFTSNGTTKRPRRSAPWLITLPDAEFFFGNGLKGKEH
jgi:hypothetical protein